MFHNRQNPLHAKPAIPFMLALRLRRISSTQAMFNTRAAQLTTYLFERGYNRNFVTKQIRRAADIPCRVTLETKDINNDMQLIPMEKVFSDCESICKARVRLPV